MDRITPLSAEDNVKSKIQFYNFPIPDILIYLKKYDIIS